MIGMNTAYNAEKTNLDAVDSFDSDESSRDISNGIMTMIDNHNSKQYLVSHIKVTRSLCCSSKLNAGSKSHTCNCIKTTFEDE